MAKKKHATKSKKKDKRHVVEQLRERLAQIDEARGAVETVANEVSRRGQEQLEETDRRSQEMAALLDGIGVQLREHAEARIDEARRRAEECAVQCEQALERVYTEAADRIAESQRALDDQSRQFGDQAARDFADVFRVVDRNTQELQGLSRLRVESALAVVEERSLTVLARLGEISERAQADAQAVSTHRVRCDELANSLVAHEADAGRCVTDARETLAFLRGQTTAAAQLVEQLTRDAERAATEAAATEGAATEGAATEGAATEGAATEGAAEGAFPDGPVDPLGHQLEAPFDESFFRQAASELRTDPGHDELSGNGGTGSQGWSPAEAAEPQPATAEPASASTQRVALLEPVTDASITDAWTAPQIVAAGPATVAVPRAELTALVEHLGCNGSTPVRITVTHSPSTGAEMSSRLQLLTYDGAGWWEFGEIRASVDTEATVSVVVDLGEIRDALASIDRFLDSSAVHIALDGDVTIGNHLLLAGTPDAVPPLSDDQTPIERIDLRATNQLGTVLETQAGRLFVAPELLGYLRQRKAVEAQLVTVDGVPCLAAQVQTPAGDQVSTVVGRLQGLGEHDEPTVNERRNTRGREVAHLVNALSANATPAELEQILKVGVGYTRRRAAAHPALPSEIIDDLIRDGTEAMRAAAASNESISAQAADIAIADTSAVVRAAVASNRSLPAHGLEQLSSDPIPHVRAHVASNATATANLLDRLAEDQDSSVRAAVASRENVAIETLLVLARDPDSMVCEAVARNSACPRDTLNELVGIVPDSVLANPNAAPSLLVAGSAVSASRLRETVARNPATPAKGLRKLARDSDRDVLRAVAEHPGTSSSIRRRARRALDET